MSKQTIQNMNDKFEESILTACIENLKPEYDAESYARATLDEMFDGIGYGDYHMEIRGIHTIHGRPVVVAQ